MRVHAYLFLIILQTFLGRLHAGDVYTSEEQQNTHFDAALAAYHSNHIDKAIKIFEYLQKDIKPSSSRYPSAVWNLALLYHDKNHLSKSIQWAEITSKFETTSFLGGFLLASLLFSKGSSEYYNSFMAFRSIKVTKQSILPEFENNILAIIDYNIAIILYKMGAVAAADAHFDEGMAKIKDIPHTLQQFKKAKSMKGVEHTIDTSPISLFRLLKITGESDIKRTEPLKRQTSESVSNEDHILAYYFNAPAIPSPHQLSNHYDHHSDYFSHKPAQWSPKITSPNIIVTPPPRAPRPVFTRGTTAPSHLARSLKPALSR